MKYAFTLTTPAATGAATLTQNISLPPNATVLGARLMVVKGATDSGASTVYLAPRWNHLGTVSGETAAPFNGLAMSGTVASGATNSTYMVFPATSSLTNNVFVPINGGDGMQVVLAAGASASTPARTFYFYLVTADIRD